MTGVFIPTHDQGGEEGGGGAWRGEGWGGGAAPLLACHSTAYAVDVHRHAVASEQVGLDTHT